MEFVSPKSIKSMALDSLMIEIPLSSSSSLITVTLLDEFIFVMSMKNPWYGGIILYLRTQKFGVHLSHEDRRHIGHQVAHYLLIGDVLYHRGVDTILGRFLTHEEAEKVLNVYHSGACGGHLSGLATS